MFGPSIADIRGVFTSAQVMARQSCSICIYIWRLWCQKQVSQAGISNCIPYSTVIGNYWSLHEIPASGTKVLIYRGYPAKRALPVMLTHGRWGPFGRIPSISVCIGVPTLVVREGSHGFGVAVAKMGAGAIFRGMVTVPTPPRPITMHV